MSNIYKQGENRKQQLLFPPSIDDYVSEDNPVRAIDDYVELLDMVELGFTKSALNSADGQPAYHPKLLLKIYIYGYLNKIRSSRKLELEIKRNIEMMWLCAGLTPSYKTISDFRKENAKPLKKVFREFVLLCKDLELIRGEVVAVDGAFLRANASKNQLITKKTIEKNLKAIDKKIKHYLKTLEFEDSQAKKDRNLKPPVEGLLKMKKRKAKLDKDLALLEEMGVTQYNRTDPDAKLMSKPAHNLMAYNSQIAVDSKFKFIVATEVSSEGNDSHQLHNMALKAKEITNNEEITIVADAGYYDGNEIKKCLDDNIDIVLPLSNTGQVQGAKGKFKKEDFNYDKENDCYICPNNQLLTKRETTMKKSNKKYFQYSISSIICKNCPMKGQCLAKSKNKTIIRWEHADTINTFRTKMKIPKAKAIIKKRGSIVEHPFGTIKQTLGWSHFLVRGKEKVSGENALIMFTYNFRRLLNLIGITLFRKLLIALKEGNIDDIRAEIVAYIAMFLLIWVYFLE